MEFFTWEMLGTMAGAVFVVSVFTELTKGLPLIRKIPTQLWSYVLAAGVLIAAQIFTEGLTAKTALLAAINAGMVSLAANGGYELLERLKSGKTG